MEGWKERKDGRKGRMEGKEGWKGRMEEKEGREGWKDGKEGWKGRKEGKEGREERKDKDITFHVSRFTFHVSRFTFHASRFTFHVSRNTQYAIRKMYKNWSRLQPVLKFRKSVEDELTLKLAEIKRRFRSTEEELIDLQNRALSLKGEFLRDGKADAASIAVHGRYLGALSYEVSRIEAKLAELAVEMGEIHGKLIQASKARKMIKKIIEKGQAAQKESERTSETKLLDEAGITRSIIRRTG